MFCKGGDLRIFRTSRDSGLIAPASGYVRRYCCVGCARISRLLSRQAQAEQLEAILITPAARPPRAGSTKILARVGAARLTPMFLPLRVFYNVSDAFVPWYS